MAQAEAGWTKVHHGLALVDIEIEMHWQRVLEEVDAPLLHEDRFDRCVLCHSHVHVPVSPVAEVQLCSRAFGGFGE